MKNIIFICLLIFVMIPIYAVSEQQNKNNLAYLDELDLKLINSIEIISTFNASAYNMIEDVEGADKFSQFLLDLAYQTAGLREMIAESLAADPSQREEIIRLIMAELKPQEILPIEHVHPPKNTENINYLERRILVMQNQINSYRSQIISEEDNIFKRKTITTNYLSLHNRHFIYNLLYCFTEIHHYLSPTNRQYLSDLIRNIDLNIYKKQL